MPVLIGTKFDDFVRLPPDLQWTIVTQVLNPIPGPILDLKVGSYSVGSTYVI